MNLFVVRTWLQARFTKTERGASMVEYILLVALIATCRDRSGHVHARSAADKFSDAGSKVSNAPNAS